MKLLLLSFFYILAIVLALPVQESHKRHSRPPRHHSSPAPTSLPEDPTTELTEAPVESATVEAQVGDNHRKRTRPPRHTEGPITDAPTSQPEEQTTGSVEFTTESHLDRSLVQDSHKKRHSHPPRPSRRPHSTPAPTSLPEEGTTADSLLTTEPAVDPEANTIGDSLVQSFHRKKHTKHPRPCTPVPTSQLEEGTTVQTDPVTEDPSDYETIASKGVLVQDSPHQRHSHPPRPSRSPHSTPPVIGLPEPTPVAEVTTGQPAEVTTEAL